MKKNLAACSNEFVLQEFAALLACTLDARNLLFKQLVNRALHRISPPDCNQPAKNLLLRQQECVF